MSALLIPAFNPGPLTGDGNNTWLVDGAVPTLIDAGVGVPAHVNAVAGTLAGRPLARVLVTHGHPDHVSGVPALRARWPRLEACKWMSDDESRADWRPVHDGQRIEAGDIALLSIHTPGHAPDHVCFFEEIAGDLYGGDMVQLGTTVMIPSGRGGNLRAYLASLERLARLPLRRILPGHGAVIDKPAELIDSYLQHRRLREEQVLECLARGVHDVDAIVASIYPALPDGVRPAARLTIEAHLEKLREEHRA